MGKVTVVLEKLTNLKDGTLLMLLRWWLRTTDGVDDDGGVERDDDGGSVAVRVLVPADRVHRELTLSFSLQMKSSSMLYHTTTNNR
jgi:hypothetical protein